MILELLATFYKTLSGELHVHVHTLLDTLYM